MKDALVGSRFQCSLEKGTLQLPPLQAVTLGILGICGVLRGPIFDRVEMSRAYCDILCIIFSY